jgi:hypothetical protein
VGSIIKPGIQNQGNQPKAGVIARINSQQGNQAKAGSNVALLGRTVSFGAKAAGAPSHVSQIAGGRIIRTNSGNVQAAPLARTTSGNIGKGQGKVAPLASANSGNFGKGQGKMSIQPGKSSDLKRTNSSSIMPGGGEVKRINSGTITPGAISPGGGGLNIIRSNSQTGANASVARNKQPEPKRQRTDTGQIAAVDGEGRQYNLNTVVVNFANVGASYAKKVLKRDVEKEGAVNLFDWEGVRRCVNYLTKNVGLKVIGVINENFWATDNNSPTKKELPADIKKTCESVEETPRIIGRNHSSADDEMTIKCAYHRNCRFLDNDNYRDWKQQLRDEKCRAWLDKNQDLLHMRYYFDSGLGIFETMDGNVPVGLLAPDGKKIPMAVSKKDLWTAPNR